MKVLFICQDYPPITGGAEVFVKEIARRLINKGHLVSVVARNPSRAALRKAGLSLTSLSRHEVRDKVRIYRVPYLDIEDIRLLSAAPGLFLKSWSLIDGLDIDIIHAVMIYPSAMVGTLLKKLTHKPLIFTAQGLIIDVIRRHKTITDSYGGILRPFIGWALGQCDFITCVSNVVERKVKQFGRGNQNIRVIPNGVDINRFSPEAKSEIRAQLGLKDKEIIITVSRLEVKNGIEYLIRAAKDVIARRLNAVFLIIGEGELRNSLVQLAKSLGVEKNVIFYGSVPHDQVAKFLTVADIFVRPSITEGFGISFVEAMACGLPVIASEAVGQMNIFEDGREGLVAKTANSEDLSNRILTLLKNESLRQDMGIAARELAVQRYDWDMIASDFESIYRDLLRSQELSG